MPAQSTFYPRVFSLVVAAALGYALWRIFMPFLNAMSWAMFLAFLLYPINLRLRRHLHGKSGCTEGLLDNRDLQAGRAGNGEAIGAGSGRDSSICGRAEACRI